jgi:hypothetical protein
MTHETHGQESRDAAMFCALIRDQRTVLAWYHENRIYRTSFGFRWIIERIKDTEELMP